MSMSQSDGERISITTTPEQAKEFIQRLAADEEFRERYERETQTLFAEYGIELPETLFPERITAPSREVVVDFVGQMHNLTGVEAFFFFPCIFFFFLGVARGTTPADFFQGFTPPEE
jgi:hypothetical protein